ncbi:MAG: methionine--tRNA ligase subunit beta, partial [Nitrospiraceae bacterium]|nr:methionine--tRNA ligase subunit beta [Nitrospiraceae bacterium]
ARWGGLRPGTVLSEFKALFPRIEKEKAKKETPKVEEAKKPEAPEEKTPEIAENVIGIEDFARVELRTAMVTLAEPVKGSNKLLRLEVDLGGETRQVIAGIGKWYKPEELAGKNIVMVANLKPAKLMGLESRGMLLAATDADGNLSVLTVEKDLKPGAKIK